MNVYQERWNAHDKGRKAEATEQEVRMGTKTATEAKAPTKVQTQAAEPLAITLVATYTGDSKAGKAKFVAKEDSTLVLVYLDTQDHSDRLVTVTGR